MFAKILSRPEALLVVTFSGLILAGGLALGLPYAQRTGDVRWVDALFTSTSAVCVTGLASVDTGTSFTRLGQATIAILIQIGGLGIMTFAAIAAQLFRRRVSFGSQVAVHDAFFDREARRDLKRALWSILLLTFGIEGLGAVLIYGGLQGTQTPRGGWFEAVFHSVSAFCNAGFSTYTDNLVGLRNEPLVVWTVMCLIVLGGLGYTVILEVLERMARAARRVRGGAVRTSLHSRVVLVGSALLIVGGAGALLLSGLTEAETTGGDRLMNALFQSVTARTAGFNTVDVAKLPVPSLMVLILLMFIGGAPGSCAGGIKVTTTAVNAARLYSRLKGLEEVNLWGRRLPYDAVRRAGMVLSMAVAWNVLGILVLAVSESDTPGFRFEHIIFEQVSAFGTVGLSAGVTPTLTDVGKVWIMATMFIGRVGPLTAAFAILQAPRMPRFQYPVERVMIG